MKKVLLVVALAAGAAGIGLWAMNKDVKKDEQAVKEWRDIFGKMDQYFTVGVINKLQDAAKLIVKQADLSPELLKMAKEGIALEKKYHKLQPELEKVQKIRDKISEEMSREFREDKKLQYAEHGLSEEKKLQRKINYRKKLKEIEAKYEPQLAPFKEAIKYASMRFKKTLSSPVRNAGVMKVVEAMSPNVLRIINFEIEHSEGPRSEVVVTKGMPSVPTGDKEDYLEWEDNKAEAKKRWEIALEIKKGLESKEVQQKIYDAAALMTQQVIKENTLSKNQLTRVKDLLALMVDVMQLDYIRRQGKELTEAQQKKLAEKIKLLESKAMAELPPEKELFGVEKNIQKLMAHIMIAVLDAAEQAINERLAGKQK